MFCSEKIALDWNTWAEEILANREKLNDKINDVDYYSDYKVLYYDIFSDNLPSAEAIEQSNENMLKFAKTQSRDFTTTIRKFVSYSKSLNTNNEFKELKKILNSKGINPKELESERKKAEEKARRKQEQQEKREQEEREKREQEKKKSEEYNNVTEVRNWSIQARSIIDQRNSTDLRAIFQDFSKLYYGMALNLSPYDATTYINTMRSHLSKVNNRDVKNALLVFCSISTVAYKPENNTAFKRILRAQNLMPDPSERFDENVDPIYPEPRPIEPRPKPTPTPPRPRPKNYYNEPIKAKNNNYFSWIPWVLLAVVIIGGIFYFIKNDLTIDSEPIKSTVSELATYRCSAVELNVRFSPDLTSKIVGRLKQNQAVKVYEALGRFAKIDYNGEVAYASTKYLIDNSGKSIWENLPSDVRAAEEARFDSSPQNKKIVTSTPTKAKNDIIQQENIKQEAELERLRNIPTKMFNVGDYAKMGSPTNCVIPNDITDISDSAFANQTNLASVVFPNSVKSIGVKSFSYCSALKEVKLSENLTQIGQAAFYNCQELESIIIPNSVTSIGHNAFMSCKKLKSITIPQSVKTIGMTVFFNCDNLETIYASTKSPIINDLKKHCSSSNTKLKDEYGNVIYANSVNSDNINKNNTALGVKKTNANYSSTSTKSITTKTTKTLPTKIFDAGEYEKLKSPRILNISNGYTEIKQIFRQTTSDNLYCRLKSVTIPSSISIIGKGAFCWCRNLLSVDIPSSVNIIEERAFKGCSGLSTISIPASVTKIGDNAFNYCSGLTTVRIGSSVSQIGDSAFEECRKISTITIPSSVKVIGNNAFANCDKLTSITIPNSVTSIGKKVFKNTPAKIKIASSSPIYDELMKEYRGQIEVIK